MESYLLQEIHINLHDHASKSIRMTGGNTGADKTRGGGGGFHQMSPLHSPHHHHASALRGGGGGGGGGSGHYASTLQQQSDYYVHKQQQQLQQQHHQKAQQYFLQSELQNLPPQPSPVMMDHQQQQQLQQLQCKKNLQKMLGISPSDIDKYSRIFFPVSFTCFNLMYWIIYLHVSDEIASDLVLLNPE